MRPKSCESSEGLVEGPPQKPAVCLRTPGGLSSSLKFSGWGPGKRP